MDDLIKAKSYAQMADSWAFRDFMNWLEDRVDVSANQAAALKPENRQHFEAYFMQWQEKKKLLEEVKQQIENCKQIAKDNDERPSSTPGDPYPVSTDTHFPGY